jgi:hypothetical protein
MVEAAATSSLVSVAQPTVDSGDNSERYSPSPLPVTSPTTAEADSPAHFRTSTSTFTLTASSIPISIPSPYTNPPHPVTDAAVEAGGNDVVEKATLHLVQAAVTLSHVCSSRFADSDEHRGCSAPNASAANSTTITASTRSYRPSTRSTDTSIHPFFVDLTNWTGKAAKHFRRLYPPTSTNCECGLFPPFASQRQSSAPTCTLPEPSKRLCLFCLYDLHMALMQHSESHSWGDIYQDVVSLSAWSEAWESTLEAHYDDYYISISAKY